MMSLSQKLLFTTSLKRCCFQSIFIKCLATVTQPSEDLISSFRTPQSDPTKHSEDHIGQFYTVNADVVKALFPNGGIPGRFAKNANTFGEFSLMVRPPAVEVINFLNRTDFTKPAIRYVLYSQKPGNGLTLTLAHIVHYAWTKKMLLLHIPWVVNWTNRPKEVVPSSSNPECMDSPYDAVTWLQHFKSQNIELLTKLNLETLETYNWSKRELTEKGQPLLDIIEHGINRSPHSSDCVAALLKEIKAQSSSGKYKVLVAVDGVNCCFIPTCIKRVDKTFLQPQNLTIVRAFLNIMNNDWNNSAVVVSVDQMAMGINSIGTAGTPLNLLGKKGFEFLEPFVPVEVTKYSRKEAISCLDYYLDRNWIQHPMGKTEQGKEELMFLSGYHPYSLMNIVAAY